MADLKTTTINMYVDGSQDKGMWQVYAGGMSFTYLPDGDFAKRIKKSIKPEVRIYLASKLKELIGSAPNTQIPITILDWNSDEKKMTKDFTMCLIKDEGGCFYMDINVGTGATRFSFGKVTKIIAGTEPLSNSEQSAIRLQLFLQWLTVTAVHELVATNIKFEQRGGGGGNRTQRSSPPSSKPAASGSNDEWGGDLFEGE